MLINSPLIENKLNDLLFILGTLNVYANVSSTQQKWLWTLSGNQGQQWLQGQVPIPKQTSSYKVYRLFGAF